MNFVKKFTEILTQKIEHHPFTESLPSENLKIKLHNRNYTIIYHYTYLSLYTT